MTPRPRGHHRAAPASLLVVLGALIAQMVVVGQAGAATTLCSSANYGYDCVSSTGYHGQSTWGYPLDSRGHNCTNYAAFRLAQNGAANPGNLGDASQWDNSARAKGFLVDGYPVVGSIAQWESNHVAYVESVTADAIETSDDSWGGTTTRRRYLRGQSDWPSNFLHIKDRPAGGTTGAATDSAAVEYGGAVHTFFYDSTLGNLRHAWSSPTSGWQFENLDGDPGSIGHWNADVGRGVSAAVLGDVLQVFYYDATGGNLRHAWSSPASGWQFENLDGDPGSIGHWNADTGRSTAVTTLDGGLQVFYYDATYGNLRHAWSTSTGWSFENLDGDPGSIGHWNADLGFEPAVVTYAGSLQLFYYDATGGNLRHAWTTSTGWSFENLDGDPGSIGHWNADLGRRPAAVVYGGSLQLFYYDVTGGNLRHAWTTSTGWSFENLDGDPGSIGHANADLGRRSAAVVHNGSLQVFYYDATNGNLRHAWTTSTGWSFENLDGDVGSLGHRASDLGATQAITLYGDSLQVFYPDGPSNTYRHAWCTLSTGWQFEDLVTLAG